MANPIRYVVALMEALLQLFSDVMLVLDICRRSFFHTVLGVALFLLLIYQPSPGLQGGWSSIVLIGVFIAIALPPVIYEQRLRRWSRPHPPRMEAKPCVRVFATVS